MVEVTLVDRVEVGGHQQPYQHGSLPGFAFPLHTEPDETECEQDEDEGAERVGGHHPVAHIGHERGDGGIVDGVHRDSLGGIARHPELLPDHVGNLDVALGDGRPVE